jgi:hypothetical protein
MLSFQADKQDAKKLAGLSGTGSIEVFWLFRILSG